jgi:predicted heme/steroid binding protein
VNAISPITVFTNLEIQSSVKSWTAEKEEASVFLGKVFYELYTDSYSPTLTEFAIARRHQVPTSVIDCHELTELIKINCTPSDFHAPYDAACFDVSNLQIAADGRHAAIHEQKTNLLANWDRYLGSMIYVTKGIGAMTAAKTIGRARGHLVRARDRAKRLVNPVQQSANPSGGQPIATKSKTTQTSRQKSTRRNKIPAGNGVNHRRRLR